MTETIQRLQTNALMSQAVVHGGVAWLAGQVALTAGGESVARQTEVILTQIDVLLEQVGSSRSRLLQAQIWLADMETFQEMNAVWRDWLPADAAPARATVEAKLAAPQFTVEIMVTAAVDG